MATECALFYNDGGTAQGKFEGENIITSLERGKSSIVIEAHHGVESNIDGQTGRAAGRRRHQPLRVLKVMDKASPHLFQALVTNEALPKLDLKWYRPNPTGDGTEQHFYTITVENTRVAKIQPWLPNTKDDEQDHLQPLEWVEFVYEKITVKYEDGNVEAMDSWAGQA